jgi:predicted transcriptional regulator
MIGVAVQEQIIVIPNIGGDMLDLDNIKTMLQDRVLSKVSDATGLSAQTIADIRDGKQTSPRYSTIKALSDYLAPAPRHD